MHDAVLTQTARKLFPSLAKFKEFYLVGGTALALQIGHRVSVDFDMFSEKPLSYNLLANIKRIFRPHPIHITYRTSYQINLNIAGVKCTFFSYRYPILDPFIIYRKVNLASVREIAAMKALAIGGRLAYKDYVDWYFLLKGKYIDLETVIDHAKRKYNGDFSDRLFLGQLSSFDDVSTQNIDFLQKKVPRKIIESYIAKAVKEYL